MHGVLSTFCHVIVEKNSSCFRACGFFWECTDEELFGEQGSQTENKAINMLRGNKSLASDTEIA